MRTTLLRKTIKRSGYTYNIAQALVHWIISETTYNILNQTLQ